MKSMFKAIATVTIFSVITRTLGFFFRIFLSRELGAFGIGIFQIASSILGIFMTVIASGIPLTTAKLVAKYETHNNLKKRNQTVASALVIAIILSIILSVLIILLRNIWALVLTDVQAVDILIVLVPSILFSAVYAVFRGALWGQNNYFYCGLTELIEQIIRFVLTFVLLIFATSGFVAIKLSAYAFNLTCLCSAIIVMIIYLKRSKLNFHFGEYKNVLKSALPITGIRVANSLVQPLITLIIPNMLMLIGYSSTEAISSFGVMMGMTFPLLFVPMAVVGSISMVLIPSITSMMAKNDYQSIEANVKKSINVSVFISMLFIPLYLSVGDLIGIVLFNNTLSGILLQLSAICVLPITLCNFTGSILNALNLEVKSFINYMIGSAVLFVGLFAFTPLFGINSIIASFFLCMTTITLLNMQKIKRAIPNFHFNLYKTSFKYSIIVLPCSLIGHFISNICFNFAPSLIAGLIGGGITLISTLLLIKVFNIFNIVELKNLLLQRKNKVNN